MLRTRPAYLLIAFAGALVQFRLVILVFGRQYGASVEAARGVLTGEPHWRVFQSRLLGPYLVQAVDRVLDNFMAAHVGVSVLLLTLAGYLVLTGLGRIHTDRTRAALGYFVFALLFLFCVSRPWIYIWDLIDLVVFALFAWFVVERRDWRWFAALFAVALFNRQSAFFIAAWMILDPLIRYGIDRVRKSEGARVDFKMLGSGVVLAAAGAGLVEVLQRNLLVREVGPELIGQAENAGGRFHFMLAENLRQFGQALSPNYALSFLVPLFVVAYIGFCIWVARRDPRENLGIAAVHLLLLGSTVAFGYAFETRVYLVLLPLIPFFLWRKR